jgi:hypothetical protein
MSGATDFSDRLCSATPSHGAPNPLTPDVAAYDADHCYCISTMYANLRCPNCINFCGPCSANLHSPCAFSHCQLSCPAFKPWLLQWRLSGRLPLFPEFRLEFGTLNIVHEHDGIFSCACPACEDQWRDVIKAEQRCAYCQSKANGQLRYCNHCTDVMYCAEDTLCMHAHLTVHFPECTQQAAVCQNDTCPDNQPRLQAPVHADSSCSICDKIYCTDICHMTDLLRSHPPGPLLSAMEQAASTPLAEAHVRVDAKARLQAEIDNTTRQHHQKYLRHWLKTMHLACGCVITDSTAGLSRRHVYGNLAHP